MTNSSSSAVAKHDVAALVVAAGRGVRAGGNLPKQFQPLMGRPLLCHGIEALKRHPAITHVHVVVPAGEEDRVRQLLGPELSDVTIGAGGDSRQQSVRLGLSQLEPAPRLVLVHDAARPLVPHSLIDNVLAALADHPGACPAIPVTDSLRQGDDFIEGEVSRDGLWRVQTPQGFHYAMLTAAHESAGEGATDDAEILRKAGHRVAIVPGDERTMKVTHAGDFIRVEQMMDWQHVSGTGFDVHAVGDGDHVWLCGVKVPHRKGLVGHSDADVALHALTDAILGALGDGDIGTHFPPSDPQWRGASSDRFLKHAADLVSRAGGRIMHIDVTIIAEAPKVGPHRPAMLERLAEILADHRPRLSVKATTTEGLGFTGRREGIAAQAIATVRLPGTEIS